MGRPKGSKNKRPCSKRGATEHRCVCGNAFMRRTTEKYCSLSCAIRNRSIAGPNGCIDWIGSKNKDGYGIFRFRGAALKAHRVAYEIRHNETIPQGYCACHRCDRPTCINPDHLFVGTKSQNTADRQAKGRQARGERHYSARLTESQVRAILRDDRKPEEVAADYGVNHCTINDIRARRTWRHIK